MERWRQNLFFIFLLFLPTQLGRHFWPDWTQIFGFRVDYLSPTLYLTDILIFLIFLFSLPAIFKRIKRISRQYRPGFLGVVFLLLFLFLGILRAKSPLVGFYQVVKWGEIVFVIFYLTRAVRNVSQFEKITVPLSLGVVFESLLALGQFLKQSSLGGILWFFGERDFSGQTPGIAQASLDGELFLRPYGTFSHPNVLAGYLVVTLVLIFAACPRRKWEKSFKWLAIILGSLALFFTFSRIAWVVGFPVIGYWLARQKKWLVFLLLIFLAIGGAGVMGARFQALLTTDQESWQRREELNSAALAMVKKHPLLGVGPGNFLVELPYFHQDKGAVRFFQPAHNLYLMIGAELGIPAFFAFLGFLFLTYRRLIKQFSNGVTMLALIFSLSIILAISFFDHYFYTLQQGQLLLALVVGLSWAKRRG